MIQRTHTKIAPEFSKDERIELLELALSGSGLGLWEWNLDDDALSLDRVSSIVIGFGDQPFTGSLYQDLLPKIVISDRDYVLKSILAATEIGSAFGIAFHTELPDGSQRCIEGRGRLLRVKEGSMQLRYVGTFRDITQIVQVRRLAKEGRDELEAVFQSIEDGVFVFDASGQLLRVNRTACRMLEYSNVDDLLKNLSHFEEIFELSRLDGPVVPSSDWPVAMVMRGENLSDMVLRLRRKDTGREWIISYSGHPIIDEFGNPSLAVVVLRDLTEQYRIEAELRRSRSNLQYAINSLPILFSYIDRDGRYRIVNDTYCKWFGMAQEQILGLKMEELLGEAAFMSVKANVDEVIAGRISSFEREMIYQYGGRRSVYGIYTPDFDDNHNVRGFFAIVTDVTQDRRARESLKLSNEQLELALKAGNLGTVCWYLGSGDILFSAESYRLFGFDLEQPKLTDALLMDRVHKDDRTRIVEELRNLHVGRDSIVFEFRVLLGGSNLRWMLFHGKLFCDHEQKPLYVLGTLQDITSRKMTEARINALHQESETARRESERLLVELEHKNALLETILNQMPMAIFVAEAPSGRLFLANEQVKQVWRYEAMPASTIEEYRTYSGFHPDGRRYEPHEWPLSRAIQRGEIIINEDVDVLRGDKTRATIRISAVPVRDSKGNIIAGTAITQDVSEQKRIEMELTEAKEAAERANLMKSSFIANVSHEIRTPLGAILGFTELLKEPNLSQAEHAGYVEIIRRNGAQLVSIIDDVLDLSKIEAGELKLEMLAVSPREMVREVAQLFSAKARAKNVELMLKIEEPFPEKICTDPTRLRQVLSNIVGNAIKFTESGSVIIEARSLILPTGSAKLTFDIIDTGIGISEQQQQRLFKYFSQADESTSRRFGGTGLGLALSRRLANALGGEVRLIKSALNEGSVFQIEVSDAIQGSCVGPSTRPLYASVGTELGDLHGLRVLLVEDALDNQRLIKHVLLRHKAVVSIANNGLECLEVCGRNHFDLVLMDIQMPVMDGMTATKKLRASGFTSPIIALTAHAMNEVREQCLSAGFSDFLVKPINFAEMISKVRLHAPYKPSLIQ